MEKMMYNYKQFQLAIQSEDFESAEKYLTVVFQKSHPEYENINELVHLILMGGGNSKTNDMIMVQHKKSQEIFIKEGYQAQQDFLRKESLEIIKYKFSGKDEFVSEWLESLDKIFKKL